MDSGIKMTFEEVRDVGHWLVLSPLHHLSRAWHTPVIPVFGR